MQRPRNRQGHAQQNDRGRGRGSRGGRGRGYGGSRQDYGGLGAVPNAHQVIPHAFVSIVLKADQGTGREVQGVVADVLTKGDHPRGMKVRLVDGRVGRVQRMVSEETARIGSEGLAGLGRNGEAGGARAAQPSGRYSSRFHDVRDEEEMALPPSGYSLGDLLPPNHPLNNTTTVAASSTVAVSPLPSQVCPVCGDFEGDEAAVSHHVAMHFD